MRIDIYEKTRILHVYRAEDFNAKKLTITVDEKVYEGLHKTIGPRKISKFVEELVRPHVVRPNLESAYAQMARDKKREEDAIEWAESTFKDIAHETA
jgi:predicted CopG family antitoxin